MLQPQDIIRGEVLIQVAAAGIEACHARVTVKLEGIVYLKFSERRHKERLSFGPR
jgi:hypothetical protein